MSRLFNPVSLAQSTSLFRVLLFVVCNCFFLKSKERKVGMGNIFIFISM